MFIAISVLLYKDYTSIKNRVDRTASSLQSASFYDLVPDDVIRKAIQTSQEYFVDSPADGRYTVFEDSVCRPILDDIDEKCWDMLYAAYTGINDWYWENNIPELPKSHWGTVTATRGYIMGIARNFLMEPERLREFYFAKRDIILHEFYTLPGKVRARLTETAENFVQGMKLFSNDTAKIRGTTDWQRIQAENAIHATGNIDSWISRRGGALFAYRRQSEGGDNLVKTWIEIGEDFLTQVKK